jgi:hypothetical protein
MHRRQSATIIPQPIRGFGQDEQDSQDRIWRRLTIAAGAARVVTGSITSFSQSCSSSLSCPKAVSPLSAPVREALCGNG